MWVCVWWLGYLSLARKRWSTHAFKITALVITEARLMLPQNSHIVVGKSPLPLAVYILGFLLFKGVVSSNLAQCKTYVTHMGASKGTLNIKGFDRLSLSGRWYLGTHTCSPCCAPLLLLCGLSALLPWLPSSRSLQHTQTSICTHAEAANWR